MTFGLTLTKRGRRVLRLVPVLLVLLVLAGGGWRWLRDSSLVRVNSVEVTGVTASDGAEGRGALEDAARGCAPLYRPRPAGSPRCTRAPRYSPRPSASTPRWRP